MSMMPDQAEHDLVGGSRATETFEPVVQRRLDRITGLLSIALDVPIAAVSLIDQHQECFKSVVGALPAEVPNRTSLGSRVVAADGPLFVEDASLDERFCRYPLVSGDPGVRFYAGFPLRDGGGDAFGTLCAADTETRQLSGRHRAVAEHLADWAAVELATAGSERNPMRSEALYHRIVESVSDGMVVLDTAGVIIETNRSAELILGFSADQMAGRESADPCWRAVRPDGSPFPGSAHPGMVTLQTGHSCRDVLMGVHHPDGDLKWISVSAEPLSHDSDMSHRPTSGPGVVCTLTDVTERTKVERLKSEFVSVVSHELRTPLTSLRGALGLMAADKSLALPERWQRMLDIASTNSERLVRLVNDILDIERVESGRTSLSLRQSNSVDLVRQSVEAMQGMADKAQVGLESGESSASWLWVDPDRIIQTITNLISNAIKFSPAGSVIRVHAEHHGSEATFEIADQGRGIPEHLIDTIFERFQQVDASDSREKGGTGLGLAICKSIAAQHGGSLSARSIVGEGSVFSLTLPALASLEPTAGEPPASGPTVLVCDVGPDSSNVLNTLFQEAGCRVLNVASVEEAIDIAEDERPDALLLDLGNQDATGSEAIGQLTAHPAISDIPLVMVVRQEASDDGVEFHVRGRRIHPQALVKRIVDLLSQTAEDQTPRSRT